MIFRAILSILFVFIFISFASAVGISPAFKNINFMPGQEVNITFFVLDAPADSFYDISFRGGNLVSYSSLSTNVVQGQGSFVLTLRFPNSIEEPGEHTVSVSVKERPSESSFINTVVEVGSTVKVFVPYPGIYGELSLNIPDGNIDDKIPVELHIINRGDQVLSLKEVSIDFVSADGVVTDNLNFTSVDILVNGDRYFRKYLNTQRINPGNYVGLARVSYADVVREVNKSFRIGSLFVNITNFTTSIFSEGIQKFYVSLENRWNSPISGVYVDVNISNNLGEQYLFRTPSVDLNSWEKENIESYFDTENLKGIYNVFLNVSYNGKSTVAYGTLLVSEKTDLIIYIVVAVVIVLLLILLYFFIVKKKRGRLK